MTDTTITGSASDAIVYEHTALRVPRELESVYRDTSPNFGWVIDSVESGRAASGHTTLRLKRDRRIRNRPIVQELQRANRAALTTIDALDRSKKTVPMAIAIIIGVIGSAFLAGSVFALQADAMGISIVLGAIGLLGWLGGWVSYIVVKARRAPQVDAAIDQQYEIVYDTAQKAAALL